MAIVWTDFAILESSNGDKQWKIQQSDEGRFRCNCPSFIFSRTSPKSCKHVRATEQQMVVEEGRLAKLPKVSPLRVTAEGMVQAMLTAARTMVGAPQRQQMVEALEQRLALFSPSAVNVAVAVDVTVGIRRITFDD